MPVPVNHVGMSDIQTEYGGSSEISLTEYYRGDQYVPINQLKSIHTNKEIPLVSGGRTQEISIGMFRGTAKKFVWVFDISQNRFTTFNLYNELVAVGWSQNIPVEVTVNVFSGVYVVPENTSSFAIETLPTNSAYPAGSTLTLNNNGFIYGRGGKGGKGGACPTLNGSNGGRGGDAVRLSLTTFINNRGVIAGGGGGGGGSGGYIVTENANLGGGGDSPTYGMCKLLAYGLSGGGGAPFGEPGDLQTTISTPLDNTRYQYNVSHFVPPLDIPNAATAAGLQNVGRKGTSSDRPSWLRFSPRDIVEAGDGGEPGCSGKAATNLGIPGPRYQFLRISPGSSFGDGGDPESPVYGWFDSSNNLLREFRTNGYSDGGVDPSFFAGEATLPGSGGLAGNAIIGGENVTWSNFGKVRGGIDNPGRNSTGTILSNSLGANIRTVSKVHKGRFAPWAPYVGYFNGGTGNYDSSNQQDANVLYVPSWSSSISEFYSYDTLTEGVMMGNDMHAWFPQNGSPLRRIKYKTVVQVSESTTAFLYGVVDDRMSYEVYVNGFLQNVPNWLEKNSPTETYNFVLSAGFNIVEILIRDDNNNSGNPLMNAHMINLTIKTRPFGAFLVEPADWFIGEINAL